MAIGTSGYIESIHTRQAPIAPMDTTWSTIGSFASLVGAGAKVADVMNKPTMKQISDAKVAANEVVNGIKSMPEAEQAQALQDYRNNIYQMGKEEGWNDLVTQSYVGIIDPAYNAVDTRLHEEVKVQSLGYVANATIAVANAQGTTKEDVLWTIDNASKVHGVSREEATEFFLDRFKTDVYAGIENEKKSVTTYDQAKAVENKYQARVDKLLSAELLNNTSKTKAPYVESIKNSVSSSLSSIYKDIYEGNKASVMKAKGMLDNMEDIPAPFAIEKALSEMNKMHPAATTQLELAYSDSMNKYQVKKANREAYNDATTPVPNDAVSLDKAYYKQQTAVGIMESIQSNDTQRLNNIIQGRPELIKDNAKNISNQLRSGDAETITLYQELMNKLPVASAKELVTSGTYDLMEGIEVLSGFAKDKDGIQLSVERIRDVVLNAPDIIDIADKNMKAKFYAYKGDLQKSTSLMTGADKEYERLYRITAPIANEMNISREKLAETLYEYVETKYTKVEEGGVEYQGIKPAGADFSEYVKDAIQQSGIPLEEGNYVVKGGVLKDPLTGSPIYSVYAKTATGLQQVPKISLTNTGYGGYIAKMNPPIQAGEQGVFSSLVDVVGDLGVLDAEAFYGKDGRKGSLETAVNNVTTTSSKALDIASSTTLDKQSLTNMVLGKGNDKSIQALKTEVVNTVSNYTSTLPSVETLKNMVFGMFDEQPTNIKAQEIKAVTDTFEELNKQNQQLVNPVPEQEVWEHAVNNVESQVNIAREIKQENEMIRGLPLYEDVDQFLINREGKHILEDGTVWFFKDGQLLSQNRGL